MKTLKSILGLLFVCSILASCSLSEMMQSLLEKSEKTERIIENLTDCHEVTMVNYKMSNGITTLVQLKLVGCEYESLEAESEKIVSVLKDSIEGFCDIRHFNLIYSGKREDRSFSYRKCTLQD